METQKAIQEARQDSRFDYDPALRYTITLKERSRSPDGMMWVGFIQPENGHNIAFLAHNLPEALRYIQARLNPSITEQA